MSSKADDFGVRYRDAGSAARRPSGGYRGKPEEVDFDMGYNSPEWDTQGFRRPDFGKSTTGRGRRQPSMPKQSNAKVTRRGYAPSRRWMEAIFLGLITNVVWALILTALHWLPRPWRVGHLRWLPPHQTWGSALVNFSTFDDHLTFCAVIGGLIVVFVAGEVLTEDISFYRNMYCRPRSYSKPRPGFGGYLAGAFFGRIAIGIGLLVLGEILLFIGGTIFNLTVGHPLLTAFHLANEPIPSWL